MNRAVMVLVLLASGHLSAYSQSTPGLWDAIKKNDLQTAQQLLKKPSSPANLADDYMTNIYVSAYQGRESKLDNFVTAVYDKLENPYPYIYALWFNGAMAGPYGKKRLPHQLALLDKLVADKKAHGTLVAAAWYQKGVHLMYANQHAKARDQFANIGSIRDWQYVGPFENISKSGLYKDYGPLAHAEANYEFLSRTNAKVKWFSPSAEIQDGWTPFCFQFADQTAVAYAQNFVSSPKDQDVLLNVGIGGAIKVWVNDALVLFKSKELSTELDTYTVKCKLQKGVNRILVQAGWTNTTYPNFVVRLTDEKFMAIPGLKGSSQYQSYTRATGAAIPEEPLPHFAEAYFSSRIAKDSSALINYLLLTDVYMRNKKTLEARQVIEAALTRSPDNNLLRMKLIEVLIKEENRSRMLEELAVLKSRDPESTLTLSLDIREALSNEKYSEAEIKNNRRMELYGEDEASVGVQINVLAEEKKFDELIKVVEAALKKYPDLQSFLPIAYAVQKEVYKDKKGAMAIYGNWLKNNWDYNVVNTYAGILQEQGEHKQSLALKEELLREQPYDAGGFSDMAVYYYQQKQYGEAEKYIRRSLAIAPYNAEYWEQLGDIQSELKQSKEAVNAYELALAYNPNKYAAINKIRKLQGKQESYKLFPETDIDKVIKNDKPSEATNTDYGYYILLDEKNVVLHPGGAAEQYQVFMVKITGQKGVDRYKESSIGYGNSQDLLMEKAEIVKPSGAKIKGDRNENEVVFTNLEVGDVVVFKYRIRNFVYGRFAKEFWDNFFFNGQIFTAFSQYRILVPQGTDLHYEFLNASNNKPEIKQVENFTQYTWTALNHPTLKDEPLSPENIDVASVLHVSTVGSWKEISDWYADVVNNSSETDFEITNLFQSLLPAQKRSKLSQFEQARLIYEYIQKNIKYSSVAFRQSAYVPQRPSQTLVTRLGDCKDLSSLFVLLCQMAGIDAQMVLVDTRNNGEKAMVLPTMEFNHCIAKARLDNKEYYLELTDNQLPFASIPNNLLSALMLEIPAKKLPGSSTLGTIVPVNRTRDRIKRVMDIRSEENDLLVTVRSVRYGSLTATTRNTYLELDYTNQAIKMEQAVADGYKNHVKLDTVSFDKGLVELTDSLGMLYKYRVKDEIAEIGSMQAFKINYPDVVATLNNFTSDSRTLPVNYLNYEDTDEYETEVNVQAPKGKTFVDLPQNELLTFNNMKYSLQYKLKSPDKLVVTRKFITERKNIPASQYAAFKAFFEKIVKAEQKLIAFK
ncbi:MAG: DUF3857 domain-containing protein [Candidatus Pseudobacter hemicellulosilyticus]|uniref:DUF3857 domain-containing protein n=1 Tax=Candidatus Pseudobacter hemicellulosilyticus TaxID=3121375 RepID=A0AAJ5WS63_9BACT|nr:MAG: DUF3857 domain-containing protein [Pseudobacter sp.]